MVIKDRCIVCPAPKCHLGECRMARSRLLFRIEARRPPVILILLLFQLSPLPFWRWLKWRTTICHSPSDNLTNTDFAALTVTIPSLSPTGKDFRGANVALQGVVAIAEALYGDCIDRALIGERTLAAENGDCGI